MAAPLIPPPPKNDFDISGWALLGSWLSIIWKALTTTQPALDSSKTPATTEFVTTAITAATTSSNANNLAWYLMGPD